MCLQIEKYLVNHQILFDRQLGFWKDINLNDVCLTSRLHDTSAETKIIVSVKRFSQSFGSCG